MKKFSMLCTMLLLAGCSSGPSDEDIRAALQPQLDALNQIAAGTGERAELHSVKSLGCEKAKEGQGFICDVEADISRPMLGRAKTVSQARFIKTDDGWRMVN